MNLVLDEAIRVPCGFADLNEFRCWTKSDEYPERGDFAYLGGEVWVDLSMETLLHNQLKGIFAIVLGNIVLTEKLGRFFADRMRLVHEEAGLSCEPDTMFATADTLRTKRIGFEQGADSLEAIGTPDMILEVVSSHSIQKDTVVLRELYPAAGISEYWLVNPTGGELAFDILRNTARGYSATRKADGWLKSVVFGRSFRLEAKPTGDELPDYRLMVR